MAESAESSRKEKILDAAEAVFADLGFDAASLRRIVLDAGVNLATVYYYFGSKEGLFEAIVKRRFEPVHQEQEERLRQLEAAFGGQPIPVEKIVEVMVEIPVRRSAPGSVTDENIKRLLGRIVNDPNPKTQQLLHEQHNKIRQSYAAVFRRSLPELPEEDLQWRLEFIWGALAFILCNPARKRPCGLCDPIDPAALVSQMVSFFAAGLRAPQASQFSSQN